MYQADENETAILDAAGALLAQVHRGVRMLDVFRALVHANTRNTQALKAWDELEAAITEMGKDANPEAYCEACGGRGERMVAGTRCCSGRDCGCNGEPCADYMDLCSECNGRGFLGYEVAPAPVRDERRALGVPSYAFPAHDPSEPGPSF